MAQEMTLSLLTTINIDSLGAIIDSVDTIIDSIDTVIDSLDTVKVSKATNTANYSSLHETLAVCHATCSLNKLITQL